MAVAVVTAVAVLWGALPAASAPQQPVGTPRLAAPILDLGHPDAAPGSFIVVLREGLGAASAAGTEAAVADLHQRYKLDVRLVYTAAIKGFALRNATEQQLRQLTTDPAVAYVAQDLRVGVASSHEFGISSSNGLDCWPFCEEAVQLLPPSWHLDRIDQRNLPLDDKYRYLNTAAGVRAYVIDTGIRHSHNDFGGRATFGFDVYGSWGNDCHGHGTHLAGVLGGTAFGVAKGVTLVSVRVLDCAGWGTYSAVIAGVDWVTANSPNNPGMNVAVMGMVGTGSSLPLETAVMNSIAAGVHYSVPAGNTNANACQFAPARTPSATTVAASTAADARASFSNHGTCVDLYAPGHAVTGPWMTSDTATNTISDTAVAAATAAGVVALWRQQSPSATAGQLSAALASSATPNTLMGNVAGTPNLLLYTRMSQG